MLPGANAVIRVAEQTVPSGLAALLVASIPLWVILLRRASAASASPGAAIGAVLVGFGGLALLLQPAGEATIVGLLACVGAALMWAIGSFASPRISLPRDPLVSTAWQSCSAASSSSPCGLIGGEVGDVHFAEFSGRSIFGLALPDHVRLAAGLHELRVAAPERADLEGLHLRVREPGRRDRARLADPRRGDHRR